MGQYYKIVNLDKRELLDPHTFGDGAKLMEFASSSAGMLTGLAILLADGNNRGGGDLHSDDPLIGSWAGDRIVVAGDYADAGKFLDDPAIAALVATHYPGRAIQDLTLYDVASEHFTDRSEAVMRVIVAAEPDHPLRTCLPTDGEEPGHWRRRGDWA